MGKGKLSKQVIEKQLGVSNEESERLNKEMLERCVKVAKLTAKMIVDEDLEMGKIEGAQFDQEGVLVPGAKLPQKYYDVALKIQESMLENDLRYAERRLVFMLLKQPYDLLQNLVVDGLEKTWSSGLDRILGSLVGQEDFGYSEFKLTQMDKLLKEYPPKSKE